LLRFFLKKWKPFKKLQVRRLDGVIKLEEDIGMFGNRVGEVFPFNDGTKESQIEGVKILGTVVVQSQNEEAVVDVRIPPQYVRQVRLKSLTSTGFEIAEFQVFGTGFVPEARYVSDIFDFGNLALLGIILTNIHKEVSAVRIRGYPALCLFRMSMGM